VEGNQDILNSVTAKPGRSRLEPYGELIDGVRRRGLTYRDIADIPAEKCQFQVSKSAINDFVRAAIATEEEFRQANSNLTR
jgi:hypothetical protein